MNEQHRTDQYIGNKTDVPFAVYQRVCNERDMLATTLRKINALIKQRHNLIKASEKI